MRGHVLALFDLSLMPDAFDRIADALGGDPERVFLLHGDFYAAGAGLALQPSGGLGTDRVATELTATADLPPFDDDGDYVLPDHWVPLVVADYHADTGLTIDDDLARDIAGSAVLAEQMQRHLAHQRPNAADRAWLRTRLEALLERVDPLGRAHSDTPAPYRREALVLSRCLHGATDESRARLWRVVLLNLVGHDATRTLMGDAMQRVPHGSAAARWRDVMAALEADVLPALRQRIATP